MRDFEDEDSPDHGEIEITDLDPQHKRKIMSALWQYGKLHRPQARVCMTIFTLAGVAILALAILSPLLAHTSYTPISTKAAPGVPAVTASVQQNAHCTQLAVTGGTIIVSTANSGTFIWIASDQSQKAATGYYCIPVNEVHEPSGSNSPIHRHVTGKANIR